MTGFRWTLKKRLLVLGGAALLPVLLLLTFWAWWVVRERTELAGAELTLASQQACSQVEGVVDLVRGHLDVLAQNPAIKRRRVDQMEAHFRVTMAEHPEIENLFALTADGRTYATAVPQPPGAPVTAADRSWFQRVISTGQQVVGDFQIGRVTGQPVAIVAIPLREGEGRLTGVLAAALSLRRLHAIFQFLALSGGRTVTVVDGEGQVLSHAPKAEGWIGRRFQSAASLPSGPALMRRMAWVEGGERIVAVMPVAGTGWRVMVGIPRASLEASIRKEVLSIALPLLALLVGVGLIGLLIARRIWRPLQALTEAARKLPRKGDVRVLADSTDEVGELARAFNAMAAQVAESRAGLEQRVAELTALFQAGRLLTGTLEFSEVLQRLAEIAQTRLGVDVVRIWLWDETTESLVLRTHEGLTRLEVDFRTRLSAGEGLAGWIMTNRIPLAVPDVQKDPRLINREWMQAEGVVSFLGIPLLLHEASLGALLCMNRTPRDFSSEEVAMAEGLAAQAAIAIENARLYERATRAIKILKESQEKVVQLERLRALSEMASGVAHDFNNILAAILGRAQILRPRLEDPFLRRGMEVIERMAWDGARTVRRIQEFARMRPTQAFVTVAVNELVNDVIDYTRPRWKDQAEAQGIRYEVVSELGEIPTVSGDPSELREALMNLVLNALEAMPQGGALRIRTASAEGSVTVTIADTGCGMSEEVRRRAFEPFFTTKGAQSTGLGLSVTYGILRRHGGDMGIESREGQGTTFTIRLPARIGVAAEQKVEAPPVAPKRATILVIDDEEDVRTILGEVLMTQGYSVRMAARGKEGLDLFRNEHYDLVLTDLGMPEMTGWQVARAVKELSRETPVILVTGWYEELDPEAIKEGAVDFALSKPFRVNDLLALVSQALERLPQELEVKTIRR